MDLPKLVKVVPHKPSPFLKLLELTFKFPGGKEEGFWVKDSGAIAMLLALTTNGEVVFVRQWKAAKYHVSNELSLELPCGGVGPTETPIQAAVREFEEEVGISIPAENLASLPVIHGNSAKDTMVCHGFITMQPIYVDLALLQQNLDETEIVNVELIPIRDLPTLIASGGIGELATFSYLTYAMLALPELFAQ